MREKLKLLNGFRGWFEGEFAEYSTYQNQTLRHRCIEQRLIIRNIKLVGTEDILTDHVWVRHHRGFKQIESDIYPGCSLRFMATVKPYTSSRKGKFVDQLGTLVHGLDYGLEEEIWPQLATDKSPVALPCLPIPQTREEAETILQNRILEWDNEMPALVSALVNEGWFNSSPFPFEYWGEKYPTFSRLFKYKDRTIMNLVKIVCLINGATSEIILD